MPPVTRTPAATTPTPGHDTPVLVHDPVEIARLFSFVREAQSEGQNRGLRVEAIQHWSKGASGDSWCAEFATMVLDIAFAGNAPVERQGGCEMIRVAAAEAGWITDTPQ